MSTHPHPPRELSFGVFDHMDRGRLPLADQYEQRLQLVQDYEQAGFYAYHLAEHHSTPLGIAPSPSVYLAAVAQRTRRLRFGPLVYTLSMHHPLRVAEEICMLDQMSRGRLEVGFGRGVSPYEIGYYGVDPAQAQSLYHEGYQVIQQALTRERVDFAGTHFSFREVPVVLQPYHQTPPPIWYGVGLPQGADWAAENGINIVCNGPASGVRAVTDRYRERWNAIGATGPLPRLGVSRHVVVADTDAQAMAIASRAYTLWRERLMHLWVKHGTQPASLAFPERFEQAQAAGLGIAGAPSTVRQWVEEEVARTGINYLVCRMAFGDLSYEESARSTRLFGDQVLAPLSRAPVGAAADSSALTA
ncbi:MULTISPECIES: LLM class flavin-dependent oxidoreductase [unclassified Hydrogenophaga]|jgi:alkanesulfonate monooxygenase SsuD/methylene tetrahydromethanopterin reductase-like flavin-dependent oxidoreductase (luciferase family)|uniref:LLM class flavin-dependent oxidoreductase n=1 Tax=unclassified Hydrogenophaga TaxID=2610897 RepID=UPI000A69E6AC|nr:MULTISPECIES: LLM class flavin-dependent oxidoreductase [unclassified Hydrogenophaga]MBN9371195.1 LLM class flavin-dependent oxidoreductase [Hydrogenophaga sp.]